MTLKSLYDFLADFGSKIVKIFRNKPQKRLVNSQRFNKKYDTLILSYISSLDPYSAKQPAFQATIFSYLPSISKFFTLKIFFNLVRSKNHEIDTKSSNHFLLKFYLFEF